MASYRDFREFFRKATGYEPYPYQEKLATTSTMPPLLDIPTGLGKTAAVVLSWLWRRYVGEGVDGKVAREMCIETPRRLVYCLPMRVLVEQTAGSARRWIQNLVNAGLIPVEKKPEVHVLMGGEIDRDWDYWPDHEAILVGTQDQLLSRVLNRGYAISRYRWPVQFGLLNNDALWVMDEVQLMGPGLATSVQLQGFREQMGAYGRPKSLWMSATMSRDQLDTPDSPLRGRDWSEICVGLGEDREHPVVRLRLNARKSLRKCELVLERDTQKTYSEALAEEVKTRHQETKGITLVILNRVRRAQDVTSALKKLFEKEETPSRISVIHSRFRPYERRRLNDLLRSLPKEEAPNHILVATQAVEAGVDISASTLVTELAPWSSLVQRFGRLNRYGEARGACAYWVDIVSEWEEGEKVKTEPKFALPYQGYELDLSRKYLLKVDDVGPLSLKALEIPSSGEIYSVVRKKDILELFDTTPDLAGNDIDVSPYIRDAETMDVALFWRDWEGESPPVDLPAPRSEELCPVTLYEIREFLRDRTAWTWDGVESSWERFDRRRLRPGVVLLMPAEAGGYDPELGWLGRMATGRVEPIPPREEQPEEGLGDDPYTRTREHITIATHSDSVVRELERIIAETNHEGFPLGELLLAARWHDRGKAHQVFQRAVRNGGEPWEEKEPGDELWAKAPRLGLYERPHFRHELASALAVLLNGGPDLPAYLVASHHGKVRLSIRSTPGETIPPDRRFARGIWDGDLLPPTDLGSGIVAPQVKLTLELMELGESQEYGPSWLERSLKLLKAYGPFRLAYLESLLRVADWRVSSSTEKVDHVR
jgi:CRISPR-associated endonuclease/helicase Cas3